MRVPFGHLDGVVPEQFRHGLQINTAHDQMAGEAVPAIVQTEIFDAGDLERPCERLLDVRELVSRSGGRKDTATLKTRGQRPERRAERFIHGDVS